MKCKHPGAYGLWWLHGSWVRWDTALDHGMRWEQMAAHRCTVCNELRAIGLSNDRPAVVQIEMRAAEFHACVKVGIIDLKTGKHDVCQCFDQGRHLVPFMAEKEARDLADEIERQIMLYIRATGSDEHGDGSLAKPYRTILGGLIAAHEESVLDITGISSVASKTP